MENYHYIILYFNLWPKLSKNVDTFESNYFWFIVNMISTTTNNSTGYESRLRPEQNVIADLMDDILDFNNVCDELL